MIGVDEYRISTVLVMLLVFGIATHTGFACECMTVWNNGMRFVGFFFCISSLKLLASTWSDLIRISETSDTIAPHLT